MTLSTIKTFFISSLLLLSIMPSITMAVQTCKNYIPDNHPDSRYINHNNGTVTDKNTGLMWKQCLEGLSGVDTCTTGTATTHTWKAVLEVPVTVNTSSGFAGHSNWRVPNINELGSLAAFNCYNPSINTTLFPNNGTSTVWSSSPDARDTSSRYAWGISFYYGNTESINRDASLRMRLVRSRQ